MKYQEKIFFTSQDIATTQDAQGAELKPVANDSKYMFQEETVNNLSYQLSSFLFYKYLFQNTVISIKIYF